MQACGSQEGLANRGVCRCVRAPAPFPALPALPHPPAPRPSSPERAPGLPRSAGSGRHLRDVTSLATWIPWGARPRWTLQPESSRPPCSWLPLPQSRTGDSCTSQAATLLPVSSVPRVAGPGTVLAGPLPSQLHRSDGGNSSRPGPSPVRMARGRRGAAASTGHAASRSRIPGRRVGLRQEWPFSPVEGQ